jgi:hypothetical protein
MTEPSGHGMRGEVGIGESHSFGETIPRIWRTLFLVY